MSIFRLKNLTGQDSQQEWANNFSFPHGVAIDLLDSGEYGNPKVPYGIGMAVDDLIGVRGGRYYENVAKLLRTNLWKLNDGDQDLPKADALCLLKYGRPHLVRTLETLSTSSYKTFLSHNFADPANWPEPGVDSKFVIAPNPGTVLHLVKSKIMMTPAIKMAVGDEMYYRVYIGNQIYIEEKYDSAERLFYGADEVFSTDQIGDPNSSGARALIHAKYVYEQPISLFASYGMRLEIGLKNNDPGIAPPNSLLLVRVVTRPETES